VPKPVLPEGSVCCAALPVAEGVRCGICKGGKCSRVNNAYHVQAERCGALLSLAERQSFSAVPSGYVESEGSKCFYRHCGGKQHTISPENMTYMLKEVTKAARDKFLEELKAWIVAKHQIAAALNAAKFAASAAGKTIVPVAAAGGAGGGGPVARK